MHRRSRTQGTSSARGVRVTSFTPAAVSGLFLVDSASASMAHIAEAMAYRRSFLRAFVSLALLFLEQSALAAEATAAPDAPRPLVIDIKSASAVLRSERRVPVSTLGVTLSIPLGRPWLRGGLSYSVAASGTPVSPRTTVRGSYALSGNLSAWTRAVWQSNGLYAAGFLEMWFPTAAFDPAGPAGAAADAAQSTVLAEPWRFTPGALGGSLGVEVGFQRGPFISAVQFRISGTTQDFPRNSILKEYVTAL